MFRRESREMPPELQNEFLVGETDKNIAELSELVNDPDLKESKEELDEAEASRVRKLLNRLAISVGLSSAALGAAAGMLVSERLATPQAISVGVFVTGLSMIIEKAGGLALLEKSGLLKKKE